MNFKSAFKVVLKAFKSNNFKRLFKILRLLQVGVYKSQWSGSTKVSVLVDDLEVETESMCNGTARRTMQRQ
jgi:hypothetical protein